jgi:phosphoenolpyruvate synthase/pyruvate phosphate dikinase
MKSLLGEIGAGLAEMTDIGLSVSAGITIPNAVCALCCRNNPESLDQPREEIAEHLAKLAVATGKPSGDPKIPFSFRYAQGPPP